MPRRLFTLVAVVSLVLCVAVVLLWFRSYRPADRNADRATIRLHAVRHTICSDAGRVVAYAPPPPADTPDVQALAAAVRNDQLVWEIEFPTPGTYKDLEVATHFSPRGAPGTPVQALAPCWPWTAVDREPPPPAVSPFAVAHPLIAALEDPERFVAAHVVLNDLVSRGKDTTLMDALYKRMSFEFKAREDGTYALLLDGLTVELKVHGPKHLFDYGGSYGGQFHVQAAEARVDPAVMPALRDMWHGRLDVPVWSVAYWQLIAATAPLPAAWLAVTVFRWRRSRRRAERGGCVKCGYDLRATPGRCPECGAAAVV